MTPGLVSPPLNKVEKFMYLGSVIHMDGRFKEDMKHMIKSEWMTWKETTGTKMSQMSLNINKTLIYGTEFWIVTMNIR